LNGIDRDEEVDRRNRVLLLDLTGRLSRGVGRPEIYVPAQSVALDLERVADHATNVAEQVVLMIQGRDIRHSGRRIR
jgi:phosphate transport system protein